MVSVPGYGLVKHPQPATKNTAAGAGNARAWTHGYKNSQPPGAITRHISKGMPLADARALIPGLAIHDDEENRNTLLLRAIATWCIRYTPVAAVDLPNGITMDITGCAHLWGGESHYLRELLTRLKNAGYSSRAAIAGTPLTAWAIAHYGKIKAIIESGAEMATLQALPTAALRLPLETEERLLKLGLSTIGSFITMPRTALRRRFGEQILQQIDKALGITETFITPIQPVPVYQERLPCLEAIVNAGGIEIALNRLLENLCTRLQKQAKGLRKAVLTMHRVDGDQQQISISTSAPSCNALHLFKLFEPGIARIAPGMGIELFILEAPLVEAAAPLQESFWEGATGLQDAELAKLMDRLSGRIGATNLHRYLPAEHYWPERSIKLAGALQEKTNTAWPDARPRPAWLLPRPAPVEVTAPVPDYPPMLFRYQGQLHKIKKADGPERIECEWWIEPGVHRDYYCVEDEEGRRYWLFRAGHYTAAPAAQWFIHGFFS